MAIETKRLILRNMTADDYTDLAFILQDDITMRAYEGAFSSSEVQEWLDRQLSRYKKDGFGLKAVVLNANNRMIGQCGLTLQDYRQKMVPEIGYLFNRDYWHQGYAIEAARAVKDYAFITLKLTEVYSIIRDTNEASIRVARKNDMILIDKIVKIYKGVVMPHYVYCVKREEQL